MGKEVSDKELEMYMKKKKERLNSLVTVKPIEDVVQVKGNVVSYSPIKIIDKKEDKNKKSIMYNIDKIHPEVKLLLYTIFLHKNLNVSQIYEISKLPLSTGNKRKEQAMKEGLLEEFSTVIKKGRGSTAKFLSITSKGYEFLGLTNKEKARGKAEHNFWIFIIREYFIKRGYKVYIEKHLPISNGFVDVLAIKDNEKIAIEVCIQKQNIDDIIEKLNKETLTRIILCFQTYRQMEFQEKSLLKKFLEEEVEKFEFKPLYEYF